MSTSDFSQSSQGDYQVDTGANRYGFGAGPMIIFDHERVPIDATLSQEQQQQITVLKTENETLKARLDKLEKLLLSN